jgi:membrane protein DedA with SNARE-associated domain
MAATAPTLAHLAAAAVHTSGPHHLRHESFDFIGLAAAAAASWFGIPGPGEPVLIAAGVLAAQHRLALAPVLIVAWAGATAGGIAGWALGLKGGRALLTWRGPLHGMRVRAVARGEAMFARHPVIGILLTPSWIAGINRVRWSLYLPLNAATAALWAAGVGIGAYLVGPTVLDVVNDVGSVTVIILLVIVVSAVVLEIRRRRLA